MTDKTFFKRTRAALFVASALFTLGQNALAHQFEWYDGRWAQEKSDIAPHPGVTYGKLENGLRWAVIPNDNPKGRVALRLAVEAGSLMEEPHELGIAHYLEHMAFNGSENFPAGTLIPFFQKNGMNFGGDTNAYTTLGETVYQLNLAHNDTASLTEGLRILRDMADRLTLSKEEVDEERGIIFSEMRARESESTLANRAWRDFLYAGSRYTNRTIGTEATLNAMDDKMMRAFYEKWYVPGRMAVVLSGDVKPADVEKLMVSLFGSMKKSPLPAVPEVGQADRNGVKFFVQERPITGTNVTIEIMHPELPVVDNEARARQLVMSQIAQTAVNRRLAQRSETDTTLFSRAFFSDGRLEAYSPSVLFLAMTAAGEWKAPLKALQEELLRARQYGVTADEFASIKTELADAFERAVKQQSAWTNDNYADQFVNVMLSGAVFTSAEQDLERLKAIFKTLTLDEVNAYFAGAFKEENRRIRVSGPVETTEAAVADYWKTLETLEVAPPLDGNALPFPYLELPPEAPVPAITTMPIKTTAADGMAIKTAELANGTRVVLQPLPFEKGTVSVSLAFGDGVMAYADDASLLPRQALSVLSYQGLGKYTALEASKLFAGRGLSVSESIGNRTNAITGSAQSADVALLLQAVWTQFSDPTVTDINRERALKALDESAYWRHKDVEGVLRTERNQFLTGERLRTKSLDKDEVEGFTVEAMEQNLRDARLRGPRTLVIAGDFDEKTALLWAARLFGTDTQKPLEKRELGLAPAFPTERERVVTVDADTTGKAVLVVAFEAEKDVTDRKRAAARQLAGVLLDERLRQILREKLAASYSPFAFYHEQIEEAGYGFLMMQIETKIPRLEEVRRAVDTIVADLLKEKVSAEELERLKKPMKTEWATSRKTNGLWEALVFNQYVSGIPYREWNEAKGGHIDAVTPEDVERELKAFFSARRADLIVKSGK